MVTLTLPRRYPVLIHHTTAKTKNAQAPSLTHNCRAAPSARTGRGKPRSAPVAQARQHRRHLQPPPGRTPRLRAAEGEDDSIHNPLVHVIHVVFPS